MVRLLPNHEPESGRLAAKCRIHTTMDHQRQLDLHCRPDSLDRENFYPQRADTPSLLRNRYCGHNSNVKFLLNWIEEFTCTLFQTVAGHPVAWVDNQFRQYTYDVTEFLSAPSAVDRNLTVALESAWLYGMNVTSRPDVEWTSSDIVRKAAFG